MKTKLFLSFFTIIFVSISFAQTKSAVKLKNVGRAKISITKGKLLSKIDLSENVAGCASVKKRTYVFNNADCSAPDASFKLIDTTEKDDFIYLVILSDAMGNCNMCGRGGSTNSFSLIWLKLDSALKMLEKKSVPIDYSRNEIYILKPKPIPHDNLSTLNLKFGKDVLTVEFEQISYFDNGKPKFYDFSHLEYNRKTPEKGFIVKTSRRKKSSIGN
jgi:hypothetical protein